jgi:hypothetical protein
MIPITMIDTTGLYTADELISTLAERGIMFATAGRLTERILRAKRIPGAPDIRRFPTLRAALKAFALEVPSAQRAA